MLADRSFTSVEYMAFPALFSTFRTQIKTALQMLVDPNKFDHCVKPVSVNT